MSRMIYLNEIASVHPGDLVGVPCAMAGVGAGRVYISSIGVSFETRIGCGSLICVKAMATWATII